MKNKITNYVISLYGIIADKIYIWHPESIDESFISQYDKSGYLKYNEEGYNNYGKDKIFVKLNKDKDSSLINLDNNIQYMKWKYTKSSKFIVFKETASTDIINDFIFDMFIFYANKLYNIILDDEERYNGPAYTTDHFVVIVGRKYESNRVPKYIFYDVGTANGASDKNTLWVEGKFLKGTNHDGLSYVVTEVRRNVR